MIGRRSLAFVAISIAVALISQLRLRAAHVAAQQQPIFIAAVDSVELDVAVMQANKPVAGLTAADFEVMDNGVKQTIVAISREQQPIDVSLVLDISGSVRGILLDELVKAVNKVRQRLRADDRLEVLTFNHHISERVALSDAKSVRTIALDGAEGSTSLNDAIVVALARQPEASRRQLAIVFTDGIDTSSFLDERSVLETAGRSQAAVFVVTTWTSWTDEFFAKLTDRTGGVVQIVPSPTIVIRTDHINISVDPRLPTYTPTPDSETLSSSFLRAFDDFRTSYVLRYSITGVRRDGWHDVAVRITKPGHYQVRARKGYMG